MKYWFDTEFIERGPEEPIRFLSIGIVSEDGREFYFENPRARFLVNDDHLRFGDWWLIRNVRPHLFELTRTAPINPFHGRNVAEEIREFCDPRKFGRPEFWAYFADYDWVVFCQLFGRMVDLPEKWPKYCLDVKQLMFSACIDRDSLPEQDDEHHALADARWTKAAYEYCMSNGGNV